MRGSRSQKNCYLQFAKYLILSKNLERLSLQIKFAVFLLGFALFIAGFILYVNGPRRYVQFENEYLGGWRRTLSAEDSEAITWFSFVDPSQNFVSNITFQVEFATEERDAFFHILDEKEFKTWQDTRNLDQTILSKLVDSNFKYSLVPEVDEEYYLVAENPSNTTNTVSVYLWWEGDFLRFDYSLIPLYLLVLLVGLGTCIVFRKTFSNRVDDFLRKWSLPLYKPSANRKRDKEENILRFDAISRRKRMTKYLVLGLFSVLILNFFSKNLSGILFILTRDFSPIRPEHEFLIVDLIVRNLILSTLLLLPLLVGFSVYLLLIQTREEDICDVLKSRLGWRRSKKQSLIEKDIYKELMPALFSRRFLILATFFSLPFILFYFLKSQLMFVILLVIGTSAMGTWLGYTIWSIFHESCIRNSVKKYAAERFMKISTFDWLVGISITLICASLIISFTTSSVWISTIESVVYGPVALLEPFSEFIPVGEVQYAGLFGVSFILVVLLFFGFVIFTLFPHLHKMGKSGVAGVTVVFILTYSTETLVEWVLQGTVDVAIQPLGLVSPIIAAIISQIGQSKYNKIIKKRLTRAKDSDQDAPPKME